MTRPSFQCGWIEKRKRKGGSVFLLRYRVRDPHTNSGWRITTETLRQCQDMREAKQRLQERMVEINARNNGPISASVTFSRFVHNLWAEYVSQRGIKPSTSYSYDSMLRKHLLPEFGHLLMDQIKPIDLTLFLKGLREQGLSSHSRLNVYTLLRTLFELAVEYEVVAANPVRKKLHRPHYRAQEKPILTPAEIRQVLAQIPSRWQPLFLCLAVTGLRIGELLGLRWQNIDLDRQTLQISHSLWRGRLVTPKTAASARQLHMPEVLLSALKAHRERSLFVAADDFVFGRDDGNPADAGFLRKQVLYPAMDRAGIRREPRTHGFHLFRHSAGSIVHAETGSLKLAQSQLGHARISTTADVYVHTDREQQKRAAEALARAIDPNCSPNRRNGRHSPVT